MTLGGVYRPGVSRLRPFARATTRWINPVVATVAPHLPGFAVLRHVGRISGRPYRTPVLLFRQDGDAVIALGSGSDVEWVRNVMAAGGCVLETRHGRFHGAEPRIWIDPTCRILPLPLRRAGASLGVSEFLGLRVSTSRSPSTSRQATRP